MTAVNGIDGRVSLRLLLPPRTLELGKRYRYGVQVGRDASSATTGPINHVRCAITILYDNLNPETPPY